VSSIRDAHCFPPRRSSDLSLDSPIQEVAIEEAGTGYANGEDLVFTGDGETAAGKVWTDDVGAILHISIADRGNYSVTPTVSVNRSEEHTSELQSLENIVFR